MAISKWIGEVCVSNQSKIVYRSDLKNFKSFLKTINRSIADFTADDIISYLNFLEQNRRSSATIRKKIAVIKGIVHYLLKEKLILPEEAEKIFAIQAPNINKTQHTPGLTKEDARKLLNAPSDRTLIGIRDRAILATLLYTGLTRSAICNLRIGSIINEKNETSLLIQDKKNNHKQIVLHSEASNLIRKWIHAARINTEDQSGYLFRPLDRLELSALDKKFEDQMILYIVKKYAVLAGLPISSSKGRGICAHSARVTVIQQGFEGGASVHEIQQHLGMAEAQNIIRYRVTKKNDSENVVKKINY